MRTRVAAAALALALGLAGCAVSAPVPSPSGPVTESPTASAPATPSATPIPTAPSLTVGECTPDVDFSSGSITALQAVPCTEEHFWEVFSVVTVPSETYPGPDIIAEAAKTSCVQAFAGYVGVAQEYSRFASAYLAGDANAWADPALRKITCLVGSSNGGLVGSAKGDTRIFPEEGQCTGPQDVAAAAVEIIDCAAPHYYEVFATKEVTGAKPPTAAEEQKLFTSVCTAGFTKFVGVAAGKSKYEVSYFLAGSDLWKKIGDHRIVCSAGSPDGGIKGTLKGKKK